MRYEGLATYSGMADLKKSPLSGTGGSHPVIHRAPDKSGLGHGHRPAADQQQALRSDSTSQPLRGQDRAPGTG
jgi:hypothetical protein